MTGNRAIEEIRSQHRVHLSELKKVSQQKLPLEISQVIEHAKLFWFKDHDRFDSIDYRDVSLHCALVIGLNIGLRFDEIHKLDIGYVSIIVVRCLGPSAPYRYSVHV